ncbi:MAG: hypothetical protein ACI8YQ_000830 [Polaribacter sp.]|jgi:hypothetical protein
MSILKKLAKISMIILAMVVLFSSCGKDDNVIEPTPTTTNNNGTANGNFLALVSNGDEESAIDSLIECFVMNFPVNVNIPDQGEVAVNSEEELWDVIVEYFENEDEPDAYPTIVFPISVTLADGATQDVADDDALCGLYHDCYGDIDEPGDWDDEEPGDWDIDPCFTFAYPISLSDGNGNTVTVNSEEDWETVFENGGDYDYFEIQFPINVVLTDGTVQEVADEDALEDLFEDCFGGEWEDPEDCDSILIEELCFDFVYPINVTLPDGSTVTATDDGTLFGSIFEYYEANPDSDEDPTLGYPVNVVLEDGTPATVNNDDELEELFEECFGDGFGLVNQEVVVGMARVRIK